MRVASAPGGEVRTVFGALNFRDIVSGGPGVTDLLVSDAFGAPVVFAVSRDGLARYGIGPGGAVTAMESVAHGGAAVVGAVPRLLDTAGALYLSGFQPEAAGRLLGPGGLLGAGVPLLGPGRAAFDMARVDDGAGAALVVQATGAGGLDLYREAAAGELTTVAGAVLAGALGEVRALDVYDGGAAPVLLALSPDGAALTAMTVEADALMATGRIDAASGVGLAAPGAIAVAAVAGQGFAVIGSAGGGALTVAGIGVAGELWLADHVLDTRDSRFAGTTAVEAIEVGDFAFVAAGGADDGVSLFTLLPDGRLVHLASLADAVDTTLAAVSALALYVADGALQVLVASASEAGMTRLSHDVSALGAVLTAAPEGGALAGTAGNDIVAGGAGDDALSGAGGADLLADGAGADVLTGGAGADLFILSGDGAVDRITDFTPGEDRLDLSDWTFSTGRISFR